MVVYGVADGRGEIHILSFKYRPYIPVSVVGDREGVVHVHVDFVGFAALVLLGLRQQIFPHCDALVVNCLWLYKPIRLRIGPSFY